jgi:predicted TIM-barrel fold metal-dependent hydrolase
MSAHLSSPNAHSEWLGRVIEEVVDPELPIFDPHHHLWSGYAGMTPYQPDYGAQQLAADLHSGHHIVGSAFLECSYRYRREGPPALRPVGETEAVNAIADDYVREHPDEPAICGAIVAFADLRLGAAVRDVLEAHRVAAPRRLRGIRHNTAWDESSELRYDFLDIAPHMLAQKNFREGFACLHEFGLTFDAWLFHPQLPELTDLARAFPGTQIIVNHLGGPTGIGRFAADRDAALADWRRNLAALSHCENVAIKLGGLQMVGPGFAWQQRDLPPTSDELLAATCDYYHFAIDCFGPDRCLFESNFPIDKIGCSYRTVWNVYKKIAREFSPEERAAMLCGNALRIYRPAGA